MIELALAIAAALIALVEEFRQHGQDLLGWAVVLLALVYVVGRI